MNEKLITAIEDAINSMDSSEIFELNNLYCENQNYSDSTIYNNDEDFFNTYFGDDVLKAVRAVSYGEYNYSHNYVTFNSLANLVSYSSLDTENLPDLVRNVAYYIADNFYIFNSLFDFDEDDYPEEDGE